MAEGLTPKQKAFAEHYAACGNVAEAARLAGYSQCGHLIDNPKIKRYITDLMQPGFTAEPISGSGRSYRIPADPVIRQMREAEAEERKARIATAQERQEWWTRVMLGLEDADMKDRLRASELLGKSQSDFVERREITGKDGAPLQVFTEITYTPVKPNGGTP
jgi:phage terminase small subunit